MKNSDTLEDATKPWTGRKLIISTAWPDPNFFLQSLQTNNPVKATRRKLIICEEEDSPKIPDHRSQ